MRHRIAVARVMVPVLGCVLALASARSVHGSPVSPATPPAKAPAAHRVTLSDGQSVRGRVTSRSPESVTLVLEDGTALSLPAVAVRSIDPIEARASEPAWAPDPNRGRYLYSPAAFTLGQGHGYVAQRAVVITSVGIGVLDALDVEAGTVLPTLFSSNPVAVAGLKAATPLSRTLRAGLGAQAFFVEDLAAGFFFGNATLGTPDAHLSVAAGGAIEWSDQEILASIATISGSLRLASGVALITENWLVYLYDREGPWGGPFFAVPSGGVRLFGSTFAVDLALAPIVTGDREIPVVPLPWLSFAWNFSVVGDDGE